MRYNPVPDHEIENEVARMDSRALIRHVCCPNFLKTKDPAAEYGAVFFHSDTRENLKRRIAQYRDLCGRMPVVAGDLENGAAYIKGYPEFPSLFAIGKGPKEAIRTVGSIAAAAGRDAGFNWTFAPCVDIACCPYNPIVGIRAGGDTADSSIRTGRAFLQGAQGGGIAATLKHFPGDGFTGADQHLTTVPNPLPFDEWERLSGRVFRTLIDEGAMSVMPGHISLPAFDPSGLPATLSKRLLTELLKEKNGFQGIIVSDAVNMGGFAGCMNFYDACTTFLEAGGDCLLFAPSTERFLDEMERRIESGKLSPATLRNRAARMLAFRRDLEAMQKLPVPQISLPEQETLAAKLARNAITVVRDRRNLLPVTPSAGMRICHLIVANNYTGAKNMYDALSEGLKQFGSVTELVDCGPDVMGAHAANGDFDLIICSVGNQSLYGTGTAKLCGPLARNMMGGWMRFGIPVIFIAHYNRFLLQEFDPAIDTLINTCGSIPATVPALLKKIFKQEAC